MGKPHLMILGAQRSGTSSLWHYLGMCPELVSAVNEKNEVIKETSFFGVFYDKKKLATYESYFDENKIGFEASPEYFHIEEIANRIRDSYDHLKFIILLRNPVKRAWSHYWHEVNTNKTETLSFDKAIKRKLISYEDKYFFSYLQTGHYAEHIERWFTLFDRKNFMIIDSESFFSDTDLWFKKIQFFLGLKKLTGLNKYLNYGANSKYPKMDENTEVFLNSYYKQYNKNWRVSG